VSVRVLVDDFRPSRSQRRTQRLNADLASAFVTPKPTAEHFALFRAYLDARHPEGGMADMSSLDFSMMIEDTHIDTQLTEYRSQAPADNSRPGRLYAVCLTDRLADGLSLVYSFYMPDESRRSLGSFVILDHIDKARRLGLPHVYLGYWVEGSRKMQYKIRFTPQEHLGPRGWQRFEG
jgi:arginine-tRNA-protein transferase